MNKIILVGNIGTEVDVKHIGETTLAEASLATNDGWGDNEKTNWHNLAVWGKGGEAFGKYVTKGTKIVAEGSVDYQSWDKDDGTKGYKTVVRVTNWEFAGSKGDASDANASSAPANTNANTKQKAGEDDLPF